MNLIEQKLAAMQIGTPVRFTQTNGQTLEGILVENDGSESLSIQISSIATIRYSQITAMETSGAQAAVSLPIPAVQAEQPAQAPAQAPAETPVKNEPDKRDIMMTCTEYDVKTSFKELDGDSKKTLQPVLNKIQSAIKSHESDKLKEAAELCWNLMQDNGLENNPDANIFYAYVCFLSEEYSNSAFSFYYAGDLRNAYRAAFYGADKKFSDDLYINSAAFSAMYIADNQTEFQEEAVKVLMISSDMRCDITGLKYILSAKINGNTRFALWDAFRYLGERCNHPLMNLSDLDKCLAELQPYYTVTGISDEIHSLKGEEIPESETEAIAEPAAPAAPKEWYNGTMATYSVVDFKGTIEAEDGVTYHYELEDITDKSLKAQLKKLVTRKDFTPTEVLFKPARKMGKDYAVQIKRYSVPAAAAPKPQKADPNKLMTGGMYEEAIEIYRQDLDTPNWEDAFSKIIQCYLALWNKNDDMGYSSELEALVAKFADRTPTTTKCLETLQQYYAKIHDYTKCLEMLNLLIESLDSSDFNHRLHFIYGKERCYRYLKDYRSAIGQIQDWLDVVKKNHITERYEMRQTVVFLELAELYYEIGDYENAEKFANDSTGSAERKQALLDKLNALKQTDELPDEEYSEDEDEDSADDSTALTLQEAYAEYCDTDVIALTDKDAAEKLTAFDENHLYCLLSWLSAAAELSKNNIAEQPSALYGDFTAAQAIQSIESAFSYAYRSPLAECDYTSMQVIGVYENSKRLIPQYNDELMASAMLRTMFEPSSGQDYNLDDLVLIAEESQLSEKYPSLVNALNEMKAFYEGTGCAIDLFAGYRSNDNVIDAVIREANELCASIDGKNDIFESQGQVRRLRELMFSDEKSELRKCLNIAAENDVAEIKFVRSSMEKLFIRSGRPLSGENADSGKIDNYIDDYWDRARDIILSEGRHVSRPHDKIKGSKRSNVVNSAKKIIACVCDWLAVAEHSANREEDYIRQRYSDAAPRLITMLEDIIRDAEAAIAADGFSWGTDSLRKTAAELLAKLNGTYNAKAKKYFFIDFLSGEDVLLDDDYLPELQSTFCGWGRMSILSRIEHHACENHVSLAQRIKEIISDDETKHNFRSARLIRAYAEDIGDSELADCKEMELINACLKQAKQRFDSMYQDFSNEIGLYESYGTISDMNGEKTAVLKLALEWYRITRITNDFGFYAKILDSIKNRISANAAERGQALMRQLEDLADKPEYDFGVYPREMIEALIEDQNYTSAEFMLNCIRRHDTKNVLDYTIEPFGYFSEFVSENSLNYRAVFGAGTTLIDKIYDYSGKKDLEKALIYLTNNARKETKGGADLLRNWPRKSPVVKDDLVRLLTKLGFNPESITPEDSGSSIESYKVICHKRSGKVTYPHCIPAFGSLTETEGFRVACLFGKFDCNSLMNSFRMMNTAAKHTLVLLDYALNMEERRRLARKIKEEKSFSKTFIVIDRVIIFYLAKHYAADTIAKRLMAVTLPFAYYQPFVEASTQTMPAELFTGREAELTSIESPEGANLVYGGRQLGKSALLKMAQHNVDKNGNNDRAILLDIQYKNYTEAAALLSQELITSGILEEGCECDNWDELARHIKKRLMDENPETRINYLLIMLDEADEFIRTSAEDDNPPIAAVKNLPADRFKLVMAGLHNLSRFNREMLQGNSNLIHLSSVVIKQFQRPEAIKLLTNTLAYLGFRFDEKVISLILAKTNYYPGLIQFYCQKLLEAMKDDDYAGYSETNTPYYEVNEGHIKKVLSDSAFMSKVNEKLEASLFTEEKGHSHYHIIALVFAYLYYDSPAEKKYTIDDLMRIAGEYKITRLMNLSKEKLEELLSEMWDLNILSKEDVYYRFAAEGFRELLGSREQVFNSMSDYVMEGEE
ncbi:MAG: hypothetical protein ACI4KM_09995 [Oscillospiraceae bacterium]